LGSDSALSKTGQPLTAGRHALLAMAASVLIWPLASPAAAALGGGAASVEADRVHLSAASLVTTAAGYTTYALTLPNGGVVKEFLGGDGAVFAVSWRAPGRPDLVQLLGDRFATFQSDNVPAAHHGRRRLPPAVNRPDFVVHSGGRPGAFHGVAYLPQQMPAGFSIKDMQ